MVVELLLWSASLYGLNWWCARVFEPNVENTQVTRQTTDNTSFVDAAMFLSQNE